MLFEGIVDSRFLAEVHEASDGFDHIRRLYDVERLWLQWINQSMNQVAISNQATSHSCSFCQLLNDEKTEAIICGSKASQF